MSAARLHNDRLGAAAVRRDIVETIGKTDDSPGAEQVVAWLGSWSDQEMLARMRKLRPTTNYEPEIVLSTFAVLEQIRDDARVFASLQVEQE